MNERVAVVTGAGSGIGQATALAFIGEGARVVAADVDTAGLAETAARAEKSILTVETDVSDEASVQALFEQCDAEFGAPAVLANIAGVGSTTNAVDTDLDTWERVFAVNARGTFLCCRQAIPRMRAAGGGSIVNMASIAGLVGLRNRAAYCASKGAVIALTRALALDHVADGIRVNCVCPGTVDSPWVRRLLTEAGESMESLVARQPLGRLGTAEEVAAAVTYLASSSAAFMTGSALIIDGGLTAG